MYKEISYQVDDPVAVITMNRPDALNAFTTRMLAEIRHAVAAAEQDDQVVGIVLTGAGRGFCAGMDINALVVKRAERSTKRMSESRANTKPSPAQAPLTAAISGLRTLSR